MTYIALTEENEECGAVVWWSLSGLVSYAKLSEAWSDAGLDDALFAEPASPANALVRAVNSLRDKHVLVRPLKKRGHFAIVDEAAGDENVEYEPTARVWLDKGDEDRPEVPVVVGSPAADVERIDAIRSQVKGAFARSLESLVAADISYWLTSRIRFAVDAVPLRDRGGMYFVPRHCLESWRAMTRVVEVCSGSRFFEIPAMNSEKAVEAILFSLSQEAGQLAEQFENELMDEALGKRAINTRVGKCRAMRDKVKNYEALLGHSLESLQERLESLEGGLAAALLTVMSSEEAA